MKTEVLLRNKIYSNKYKNLRKVRTYNLLNLSEKAKRQLENGSERNLENQYRIPYIQIIPNREHGKKEIIDAIKKNFRS